MGDAGQRLRSAVAALGATGRAVARAKQLRRPGLDEVVEVTPGAAARQPGRVGALHRGHAVRIPVDAPQRRSTTIDRLRADALRESARLAGCARKTRSTSSWRISAASSRSRARRGAPRTRRAAAQRLDLEGLDEVLEDPAVQGAPDRLDVAGGADDDDVDLPRRALAEAAQHVEAAHVGQVDVEQDEVGRGSAHRLERAGAGARRRRPRSRAGAPRRSSAAGPP